MEGDGTKDGRQQSENVANNNPKETKSQLGINMRELAVLSENKTIVVGDCLIAMRCVNVKDVCGCCATGEGLRGKIRAKVE